MILLVVKHGLLVVPARLDLKPVVQCASQDGTNWEGHRQAKSANRFHWGARVCLGGQPKLKADQELTFSSDILVTVPLCIRLVLNLELGQVNCISQEATNSSKTSAELAALLGPASSASHVTM